MTMHFVQAKEVIMKSLYFQKGVILQYIYIGREQFFGGFAKDAAL